jgi:hypothetical protein
MAKRKKTEIGLNVEWEPVGGKEAEEALRKVFRMLLADGEENRRDARHFQDKP